MDFEQVRALVETSRCPVAVAVLAVHQPEQPPEGSSWIGGGKEARCTGESSDPFDQPAWPCETVEAVIRGIAQH